MKNFFEVIAKCGHVGRNKYIPIKFAVEAESGKDVAAMVRHFPRVKHNHKDAILSVTKIDYTRYLEIEQINENNPYLKCKSKYEQKKIVGLYLQLEDDVHSKKVKYKKEKCLEYKIRKNHLKILSDIAEMQACLVG